MKKCNYCGESIVWLKNGAGQPIAVNADTYHGELTYDITKHQAHVYSCTGRIKRPESDRSTFSALTPSEKRERGIKD